mmetsp:Transcript_18371/g.54837  ORF Transcript_18371/g.54837 Transcript_18371/m.54837 type:complete len:238 (-) Transcript_18371:45-758(-)
MPVRCTAAVHRSGVRMRPSAQQCLELLIVNLRLAAADDLCDIDPQIKIREDALQLADGHASAGVAVASNCRPRVEHLLLVDRVRGHRLVHHDGVHELAKVNLIAAVLVDLTDHEVEVLVSGVLTKRLHRHAQLLHVDCTAAVLVVHMERLLAHLDFLLVEPRRELFIERDPRHAGRVSQRHFFGKERRQGRVVSNGRDYRRRVHPLADAGAEPPLLLLLLLLWLTVRGSNVGAAGQT